jgi:hypothetical protein
MDRGPTPSHRSLTLGLGLAFSLLVAAGCPDPNPVGSYDEYGADGPSGSPGADKAGKDPASQGASQPNDARFKCKADECVKLGGDFVYSGEQKGMNRLDFQTVFDNSPPRLAHTLEIRTPGPWSVDAPKGIGRVRIVAFIDVDANGPSKNDPGAVVEVEIGDVDLTDVTLDVTDDFDIAVLRPGGGPGGMQPVGGDPTASGPGEGSPDGAPDVGPEGGISSPDGGAPGGSPPDGEAPQGEPQDPAPGEPQGPPADAPPE